MATEAQAEMTNAELLHFYLGLRLQKGDGQLPLKHILTDFPEYLRQRRAMRGLINEAEEAIEAGRSEPLEIEQAIDEVIQQLAAEGTV